LGRWNLPEGLFDWFADLRALAAIAATGTLAVCYWLDRVDMLPRWVEHAILSYLLFYIGAR
jgi:hypothetical protein